MKVTTAKHLVLPVLIDSPLGRAYGHVTKGVGRMSVADDHVAWLTFRKKDGTHSDGRIRICDSDSPGAFRVYRAAPVSAAIESTDDDAMLAALRLMAGRWGLIAHGKFVSAEKQKRSFARRFIEHGATCYFNCAIELLRAVDPDAAIGDVAKDAERAAAETRLGQGKDTHEGVQP